MKFDMVARFRETIPTVKSVLSSKILKIFRLLPKLPFYPFLENLNFLWFYTSSKFFRSALFTNSGSFLNSSIDFRIGSSCTLLKGVSMHSLGFVEV